MFGGAALTDRPKGSVLEDGAMATLNVKGLPDELYEKLKARAKQDRRSVAQEVTHLLAAALEEPRRHSILELQGLGKELWQGVDPVAYVEAERSSWN
jgi:plasmid stability protein